MSKSAWSPENVEFLTANYKGNNENLPFIAAELKRSVSMVRSKLVSMKVYVKQDAPKVGGASPVRKIQLVREFEKLLKVNEGDFESFEKASKLELEAVIAKLKEKE